MDTFGPLPRPTAKRLPALRPLPRPLATAGFSLVEVTLAIGIVAFAFVALLGILPVGLNTFRASAETTNETRIIRDMTSMIQAAEYEQLDPANSLGGTSSVPPITKNTFYFDVDGAYLDSANNPSSDPAIKTLRIYEAKVILDNLPIPGSTKAASYTRAKVASNAYVIFRNSTVKASKTDFDSIQFGADIRSLKKTSAIKVMPIVLAKMDGQH